MQSTTDTSQNMNSHGADFALKLDTVLKDLIKCLTQETLALKSHDRFIANKMSEEKSRLLHIYKKVQSEIKATPDILDAMDDDLRKHLRGTTKEFERVLLENASTINSGKRAVTRLIERLVSKARDTLVNSSASYTAAGTLSKQASHATLTPTRLNETL